jgi:hypothetical protein
VHIHRFPSQSAYERRCYLEAPSWPPICAVAFSNRDEVGGSEHRAVLRGGPIRARQFRRTVADLARGDKSLKGGTQSCSQTLAFLLAFNHAESKRTNPIACASPWSYAS